MSNSIDLADLLKHAAELIENNAEELHIAFAKAEGGYGAQNRDIEKEIDDMVETASRLISLTSYPHQLHSYTVSY